MFIISGAPNTGKTHYIASICEYLLAKYSPLKTDLPHWGYFKKYQTTIDILQSFADFSCVLDIKGKKVLIQSASDDQNCAIHLKNDIIKYSPDIVFCTSHDFNSSNRAILCKELGLIDGNTLVGTGAKNIEEYSLGKIYNNSNRRNINDALTSYFENTKKMILKNIAGSPYYL